MMREVGHAPAIIDTGLCCYDCFLRELPAGRKSPNLALPQVIHFADVRGFGEAQVRTVWTI
jgi:hypothetical protein